MSNLFTFLSDVCEKQRKLTLQKKFLQEQVEAMQRQLNSLQVELTHLTRNLNSPSKKKDPLAIKMELNLDDVSRVNEQQVTLNPTTSLRQMYLGKYFNDEEDSEEDF